METAWMIKATQKECDLLGIEYPAWWTGADPKISEIFSSDSMEGVRFARREDAERVIRGWGYSLANEWCFASEHAWY